jgi:murein DD-endopeptidase MepM/ murein hydrolase activator NlpD
VLAVAACALAMLGPAGAAHAAPETVRQDADSVEQVALEMKLEAQVAERAQVLADLNRRADARDRAIAGLKAVLARYGYHGDPDRARVVLPLASYHLSAGFGLTGPLWEAEHGGQDFGASTGDTLVAVAAGTVTDVSDAGPYGLRTILALPDGTEVWYCHQTSTSVYAGQPVEIAQPVGTVGSTGNTTGPHLHLEVRPGGGGPVDPMTWLRDAGLTP